ncbi:MAG: RNA polymerase sigma factor [Proteobacteria bacterium]|nr:RNA polymerase sigma factor [Pseudomonadota bacterium]
MNESSALQDWDGAERWNAFPPDEEIADRVRAGEVALYEVLMRRHNQRLYRAVRAILRDEAEIDDLLQETYLSAYRNLARFEGRARFSTWLTRIAVNRALDRRRRAVVEEVFLQYDHPPATSADDLNPERQSARREFAHLLEEAIDALPDIYRGVYVLRELEGMDIQETSEAMGLDPTTVKTRLHRARGLLRERLACHFDSAAVDAFPFGAQRCDRLVAAVLEKIAEASR